MMFNVSVSAPQLFNCSTSSVLNNGSTFCSVGAMPASVSASPIQLMSSLFLPSSTPSAPANQSESFSPLASLAHSDMLTHNSSNSIRSSSTLTAAVANHSALSHGPQGGANHSRPTFHIMPSGSATTSGPIPGVVPDFFQACANQPHPTATPDVMSAAAAVNAAPMSMISAAHLQNVALWQGTFFHITFL